MSRLGLSKLTTLESHMTAFYYNLSTGRMAAQDYDAMATSAMTQGTKKTRQVLMRFGGLAQQDRVLHGVCTV
jgi:hypothetical protein